MVSGVLSATTRTPVVWGHEQASGLGRAERAVLDLVFRRGPISLTQIAATTGFTQQYISRIIQQLITAGAVANAGRAKAARGQPSVVVSTVPQFACSVGISIMTDALRLVLIDFSGAILADYYSPLESGSREHVVSKLKEMLDKTLASSPRTSPLVGIGIAITGYFVGDGARVNPPPALGELALIDIEELLTSALRLPVYVENDGNAAAAGESLLGVGRTVGTFAYLYFSAGLGGGIVINGEPFRGSRGNAGEFANILEEGDFYPTLENLRQMVVASGVEVGTLYDLIERFDPRWPGVERWVAKTEAPLNRIISAIASVFDPDVVVLGGRIPKPLTELLIPNVSMYNASRRNMPKPQPRIAASETECDATAVGAALLPLKSRYLG